MFFTEAPTITSKIPKNYYEQFADHAPSPIHQKRRPRQRGDFHPAGVQRPRPRRRPEIQDRPGRLRRTRQRRGGKHLEAAKTLGYEVEVYTVADFFQDRADGTAKKYNIPADRVFTGADRLSQLLEQPIDIVLLATPPYSARRIWKPPSTRANTCLSKSRWRWIPSARAR